MDRFANIAVTTWPDLGSLLPPRDNGYCFIRTNPGTGSAFTLELDLSVYPRPDSRDRCKNKDREIMDSNVRDPSSEPWEPTFARPWACAVGAESVRSRVEMAYDPTG
jgi:hypothetical protein